MKRFIITGARVQGRLRYFVNWNSTGSGWLKRRLLTSLQPRKFREWSSLDTSFVH
jgi:hypothetical protein